MKNVAILAVLLGVIGNAAIAESAVSEAPLTLAMNSNAAVTWIKPATAINNDALADDIELEVSKAMEKVSVELGEQLEAKIAKELEYAMH
ncbi:hypothetical protein [Oceanicoccus sp. KOV_DT_Chl]|uniref:hypothetical protein n=1 Tax=Oceanicoccus sp. KOV_DT_Chl TaxID=1904639 RepID=UPI000C7D7E92|nr:hypothetical protein [Oceanicoccus sp. KOV_DT_Chl]